MVNSEGRRVGSARSRPRPKALLPAEVTHRRLFVENSIHLDVAALRELDVPEGDLYGITRPRPATTRTPRRPARPVPDSCGLGIESQRWDCSQSTGLPGGASVWSGAFSSDWDVWNQPAEQDARGSAASRAPVAELEDSVEPWAEESWMFDSVFTDRASSAPRRFRRQSRSGGKPAWGAGRPPGPTHQPMKFAGSNQSWRLLLYAGGSLPGPAPTPQSSVWDDDSPNMSGLPLGSARVKSRWPPDSAVAQEQRKFCDSVVSVSVSGISCLTQDLGILDLGVAVRYTNLAGQEAEVQESWRYAAWDEGGQVELDVPIQHSSSPQPTVVLRVSDASSHALLAEQILHLEALVPVRLDRSAFGCATVVTAAQGHGLETGHRVRLAGVAGWDAETLRRVNTSHTVEVVDRQRFKVPIDTNGASGVGSFRSARVWRDARTYVAQGVEIEASACLRSRRIAVRPPAHAKPVVGSCRQRCNAKLLVPLRQLRGS
mmetsp:Transcript_82583/g.220775  ORF Transcript_82583/g.220775 Transcript_82583/m.220775 type:complete len:487 (-) Transcript_82583:108-1568(-)